MWMAQRKKLHLLTAREYNLVIVNSASAKQVSLVRIPLQSDYIMRVVPCEVGWPRS